MHEHRLTPDKLRRTCDPRSLDFTTTESLDAFVGMIGQERAVRAMEFGMEVPNTGYNIYMAGITGTGKTTFARNLLEERSRQEDAPTDWCYVYNFKDPDRPLVLALPTGRGPELARLLQETMDDLRRELPGVLSSEEFEKQKTAIAHRYQARSSEMLAELEKELRTAGFSLTRMGGGFAPVPVVDGKTLSSEEFQALSPEEKEKIQAGLRQVQGKVNEVMRRLGQMEKEAKEEVANLERDAARLAVEPRVNDLKSQFPENEELRNYLEQMEDDILKNLKVFQEDEEERTPSLPIPRMPTDPLTRYRVNVLVNHDVSEGAPVVVETNPTYANLCGSLEYRGHMGVLMTDFTMIKAGALHRANGGYLLLQAQDVLREPLAWTGLVRALKNREIRMENPGRTAGMMVAAGLQPEPIPLDVKVILIGHPLIYQMLYSMDEDFRKLFKIKAEFDSSMERNDQSALQYARFIASVCQRDGLKPFDPSAVAKVVEYGSRLVADQRKISTRFNEINDIIYEAAGWAKRDGVETVTGDYVRQAINEKRHRSNLIEEKVNESFLREITLISTGGEKTGQVNGVAVYGMGDFSFGKPSRITARTFPGRVGLVNIERESQLSGRLHSKGVLILQGYLGGNYATKRPLALHASLAFEQTYEEIDGDSASSAELYALLSALADVPIKQGIAVTGSVNQHGEIQPVGGVIQKIEGFFTACQGRGLTGEQGVIIPKQNVEHLMLDEEVIEAVEAGKFHIWAVSTIDEGIEVITGRQAGERQPDGSYPKDSVHALVDARLAEYADIMQRSNE